MSLLRRRMMMGAKQADFPLVEVENISIWTASVTDDARNYGWTLEKPHHLGFTSLPNNLFVHMLTDSDFLCMDVPDNDGAILVDRNLFIPNIGFWYISGISTNYATNITAQSVKNGSQKVLNTYTVTPIIDSIGRRWVKVLVGGLYSATIHRQVFTRSSDMPVYYCTEADLGKVFPQRRWDKHYYVYPDVKIVNYRDNSVVSNYFNGLKYSGKYGVVVSDLQNNAPANYNGVTEGYLIEVPDYADQIEFDFTGANAWISIYDSELLFLRDTSQWITNKYTLVNTSEIKYVSLALNGIYDISVSVILQSEW